MYLIVFWYKFRNSSLESAFKERGWITEVKQPQDLLE